MNKKTTKMKNFPQCWLGPVSILDCPQAHLFLLQESPPIGSLAGAILLSPQEPLGPTHPTGCVQWTPQTSFTPLPHGSLLSASFPCTGKCLQKSLPSWGQPLLREEILQPQCSNRLEVHASPCVWGGGRWDWGWALPWAPSSSPQGQAIWSLNGQWLEDMLPPSLPTPKRIWHASTCSYFFSCSLRGSGPGHRGRASRPNGPLIGTLCSSVGKKPTSRECPPRTLWILSQGPSLQEQDNLMDINDKTDWHCEKFWDLNDCLNCTD